MTSIRAIAEASLIRSGLARLLAQTRRGRTLILAYHNVAPDALPPAGDRSLHVAETTFAAQLDMLVEQCEVVSLSSVLQEPPARTRARVVITFDDAYRGALTLGAAALRARGLPATMFVPPALLGRPSFWWDAFAGPNGLEAGFRAEALGPLRGDDDAVRAWAAEQGLAVQPLSPWLQPGTESELNAWVGSGLTVAAHTWRHVNLTRLSDAQSVEELHRPQGWLRERFGDATEPWLTYPYGLAAPAVAELARAAGYKGALLVSGGWVRRPIGNPYMLPRLNVPAGLSIRGFQLRLAGLSRDGVASLQQVGN